MNETNPTRNIARLHNQLRDLQSDRRLADAGRVFGVDKDTRKRAQADWDKANNRINEIVADMTMGEMQDLHNYVMTLPESER
jgi:hypothetical protein